MYYSVTVNLNFEFGFQMCSLISFKERYHEYRSKCHTQEEEMLALQSRLQHRAEEIEALKGELSSMNEARQCVLQQFNDMKREKGELEDMFAANSKNILSLQSHAVEHVYPVFMIVYIELFYI